MKFSDFNLHPSLVKAIENLGYNDCTPIQEKAIPTILEGKDLAGLAQTGTGKTAAFLIPLIERILRAQPAEGVDAELAKRAFPEWRGQNFILVLVPTRELAEQVQDNVKKLSEAAGLRGFAIYGGTGYDKQKAALAAGLDFLVATPGRMIDLYKENLIDLKQVRAIVFDEADRMFDMGFKDDMKYILQRVPKERQFLVFSATLNLDVLNTAYQFGAEPVEINISKDQTKAENVKDWIFHVGNEEKPQHLLSLMKLHQPKQAIIFTNFKFNVEKIARFLTDNGLPAMAISSLLSQSQRNRVIEQFKEENHLNILVATDVAARGLDIKGVDLVINYELPSDAESYVHRIGRTGRAGAEGKALSLVSDRDIDALARIEEFLKHKVDAGYIESDQLIREFKSLREGDRSRDDRSRDGRQGGGQQRRGRDGQTRQGRDGQSRQGGGDRPRQGRGGSNDRSGYRDQRRDRPQGPDMQAGPDSQSQLQGQQPQGSGDGSQPNQRRHDHNRQDHGRNDQQRRHKGRGPDSNRDHRQNRSSSQTGQSGSGEKRPMSHKRDNTHEGRASTHSDSRREHGSQRQGQQGHRRQHGHKQSSHSNKQSIGTKITGFFKKIFGK